MDQEARQSKPPFFSIVIPTLNRPDEVRRAIRSCLSQDFSSFEVIVVDDGSAEPIADVVAAFETGRVRCVRHPRNRGLCPARSTGVHAATGRWIVFLDSDDELLPGGLSRACDVIQGSTGVDRFGFQFECEGRAYAPFPLPRHHTMGYREWLEWIEIVDRSDALFITRRDAFDGCPIRRSSAGLFAFGLDFTRQFKVRIVPEILARVNTDAVDRMSILALPPASPAIRAEALERIPDWRDVLAQHGPALRAHAPNRYQAVLRGLASSYSLAGLHRQAISTAAACIRANPVSVPNWATLAFAACGPRAMAVAARFRSARRKLQLAHQTQLRTAAGAVSNQ